MSIILFVIFFKILGIIRKVANAESYKCGDDQLHNIIKLANGNVRKAILLLESSSVKYIINNFKYLKSSFSPASIQKDWTITLKTVSSLITKEQNPNTLLSIRATFYDLLNHCIPASLILKNLSLNILESTDSSLAPELCSIFAEYVSILI
jgi:replication factor C subunit 3/5